MRAYLDSEDSDYMTEMPCGAYLLRIEQILLNMKRHPASVTEDDFHILLELVQRAMEANEKVKAGIEAYMASVHNLVREEEPT